MAFRAYIPQSDKTMKRVQIKKGRALRAALLLIREYIFKDLFFTRL